MKFNELRKKRWFSFVSNIYVVILTIFLIWMLFFDANSLLTHLELKSEIEKLEKQKEYLQKEINEDKRVIKKLNNMQELERYAREKYYLKKEDEEIYLIEYQDSLKFKKNE